MTGLKSEVKGSWFVTGRNFIEREGGDALLGRVEQHLGEDRRHCLRDPLPSEWYQEEDLQQVLAGVREELAGGSSGRFLKCMEGCTEIGINRFFRVVLRMTSARFALRQVPAMWKQIRRGAGHVAVRPEPDRMVLEYSQFPYFADENYRLLTQGSLAAVAVASTGSRPEVTIEGAGPDWLEVAVWV